MGKFKVGDRVKCVNDDNTKCVTAGNEYVVRQYDGEFITVDMDYGSQGGMSAYRFELVEQPWQPWQPKVGDRVRLVKDARSTTGAIGKTATISSWSGKLVDNGEYLLNIDPPVNYETMASPRNLTRATIDCFEPLPVFALEAGKFYKTRDGRKVGPAFVTGSTTTFGEKGNWSSAVWTDTGRQSTRDDTTTELANDIVAEWIDEPTTTASNDNAAPAKFRAGDWVKIIHTDYEDELPVGGVHRVEKSDDDGFELKSPVGLLYFYHSEAVPAPAAPTPTAIVALIEDGQPKPSSRPFVHATESAAKAEASRLAGKHKGQQFGVYVLTTTSQEAAPTYKHEWQRLAAKGKKIDAIKELRAVTGMPLKQSKDVVEHFVEYPYGAAA
ncbi:hypothetical protein GGE68_002982 [Rhizobium leguminosarum]|uniref:hypothetical protein n=1 Tax=Rhizobium leguminosarum TaxID=384 RepID=UPI001608FB8E|nr:hypothetical protein [Rhizobium leguminosarum]MBB5664785.1 hypothetical protein [Rhizobium leguminosarum]